MELALLLSIIVVMVGLLWIIGSYATRDLRARRKYRRAGEHAMKNYNAAMWYEANGQPELAEAFYELSAQQRRLRDLEQPR